MVDDIRLVNPSRREVSAPNPRVNPDAFGQGLSQALGNFSAAAQRYGQSVDRLGDANKTTELAYKDRRKKLDKSDASVRLIQTQNEFARRVSELQTEVDPGAPDFTNNVNRLAEETFGEYMRSIPEELRPDFAPSVEQAQQSAINSAFEFEITAQNKEFVTKVTAISDQVLNEFQSTVIRSPDDLDALEEKWAGHYETLFNNSPLDQAQTRDLLKEQLTRLKTAKMARLATEESLGHLSTGVVPTGNLRTEGQAVISDNPIASGLPPVATGLLNAIAGPESAGAYNIMYSPNGNRYFQDFSDHPNQPETITHGPHAGKPSSAAGRYQFINGTWRRVQQAYGIKDFSPASQDFGAWMLAKGDYAARTGKNLETVLRSGHVPSLIQAKLILSDTWEGLKNITNEEFVRTINGGQGTPSALLADEEFSGLPYGDRLAIVADAQAAAQGIQAQMAADAKKQRDSTLEDITRQLYEGEGGNRLIEDSVARLRLSVSEEEGLRKTYAEAQTVKVNAENMTTKLSDPGYIFDKSSDQDKKELADFYQQTGAANALRNMDQDYVDQILTPSSISTGYIPTNVSDLLSQQIYSQNPEQATFALEALTKLRAESPVAFTASFDKQVESAAVLFESTRGSLPAEQLLGYIRAQEMDGGSFEQVDKLITEARKDNAGDFTGAGVASRMGAELTDPLQGNALFQEYYPLYRYHFAATNNHKKARSAAIEQLNSRWGTQELNGREHLMRYPPNKMYPTFRNSHDYVEEQLRTEFNFTDETNYNIVSDHITEKQVTEGQVPTYSVIKYDEYGLPNVMKYRDLAAFGGSETDVDLANEPVRFFAEISDTMQIDLMTETKELNDLKVQEETISSEIEKIYNEAVLEYGYVGAMPDEVMEKINGLNKQLLDTKLERRGKQAKTSGGEEAPIDVGESPFSMMGGLQQQVEPQTRGRGLDEAELPPVAAPAVASAVALAPSAATPPSAPVRLEPIDPGLAAKVTTYLGKAGRGETEQLMNAKTKGEQREALRIAIRELNDSPRTPGRVQLQSDLRNLYWSLR